MAEGFLGRWSKRKLEVKDGKPLEEATAALPVVIPVSAAIQEPEVPVVDESPPPLTLDDTQALTPESDFKPFMNAGVAPEVKNAAMKKLFADPHFNVMDGLDTYIDDYSKPDPIPQDMLRKMVSAKFLGLFDDEEKEKEKEEEKAGKPVGAPNVAQSGLCSDLPSPSQDADPDLRLQPDDAAPGKDPGRGAQ